MPTLATIARIEAIVADARAHPRVREVAIGKLAEFRRKYPHLFAAPNKVEDDPDPWEDVEDTPFSNAYMPQPPPPSARAMFMDPAGWDITAAGNPRKDVFVRGVDWRVVLFAYKKTPHLFGWLIINLDTEEEHFSKVKYPNREMAREAAWLDLTM